MIEKTPTRFLDPTLVPWQPEGGIDGLYSKTLSRCEATGSYTRLLKFLPGTNTSEAGVQDHDHLEELWLVVGAIYDLTLEQNFVAGMYANRLRHMNHGPWRSPDGALIFELRDRDDDGVMAKDQLEFFDPELLPWESQGDCGVYVKTLATCPNTGSYGRLVKFAADTGRPETAGETARSELWIVDGVLHDTSTGSFHPSGHYGNLELDLLDGTWSSPYGCVVFEVRNIL